MRINQKYIMVAMSGGVDSTAAALLLKNQGASLLGATLDLRFARRPGEPMSQQEPVDLQDARAAAQRLGIAHLSFPMGQSFREQVVQPFVEAYLRGDTPNPCIDCNLQIKFGLLLEKARELGQDFLATGHYARCFQHPETGRWVIARGVDSAKDQTYVLWRLTQRQLSHILFPLGDYRKEEIRSLAQEAGLVNAQKPDSQDICFIPDGDYGRFLEEYLGHPLPEGDYLNVQGEVLGKHRGMARYTMGQRKGLGIALGAPAYVLSKDPVRNTVTLGKEESLYCTRFLVRNPNWIAVSSLTCPTEATVKTRYTQREAKALLHPLPDGMVLVELSSPERAVTPGQSAVFYQDDLLLGGGFIIGEGK